MWGRLTTSRQPISGLGENQLRQLLLIADHLMSSCHKKSVSKLQKSVLMVIKALSEIII